MNNLEKEVALGSVAEIYNSYADNLEHHPSYKRLKAAAIPGVMTIEQYVGYLRERAAENYTNQTAQEEEREFQQALNILNQV